MKPSNLTWGDVLLHLSQSSWSSTPAGEKRYVIAKRVVTLLGEKEECRRLTQKDVDRVSEELKVGSKGRVLRAGSLRNYLGILIKVLGVGRDLGATFPQVKVRRPRAVPTDKVTISREEEAQMMENLERTARGTKFYRKNPGDPTVELEEVIAEFYRFGWWIKFMLGTGLRPSESFRLVSGDLVRRDPGSDGQERYLLRIQKSKTGVGRSIPLVGEALEAWRKCEPYGLWSDYTDDIVRGRYWNRLMDVCQFVQRYTPYDLRHTYATRSIESGMDIEVLSRLMGHSSLDQTKQYVHRSEESKFKAVEAVYS